MKSPGRRLELVIVIGFIVLLLGLVVYTTKNNFDVSSIYITNINTNINKPGRNYIMNNEYVKYRQLEGQMIKSTQDYIVEKYPKGLIEGIRLFVSNKTLQKENLMGELYDPFNVDIVCSGYVRISKVSSFIDYDPFLKCDEYYKTIGYIEKLDEK